MIRKTTEELVPIVLVPISVYKQNETKKNWRDSTIQKLVKELCPYNHIERLGAIHGAPIHCPASTLVVVNCGDQGPGTYGGTSHGLEAKL